MIKAVALRFGYVESNSLSWLVFQAEDKPCKTKKQAFLSLAEFLYQKFCKWNISDVKGCCTKSKQNLMGYADINFCPQCGTSLSGIEFDYTNWSNFLEDIRTSSIDSFRYSDDTENEHGWDASLYAFEVPAKQMVIVQENATEMLSYAVAELHPESEKEIHREINECFFDDYQDLFKEKK